jgi:hypothetical protein
MFDQRWMVASARSSSLEISPEGMPQGPKQRQADEQDQNQPAPRAGRAAW